MKIIVCMKQSVSPEFSRFKIEEGNQIGGELSFALNEFDSYALQAAVNIKEEWGGEVVTVCVGGDYAENALYESIALGADRAICVRYSDHFLADPSVTAGILCELILKEGFELVVTGAQSVDSNASVTSMILAERLDAAHVWNVSRIVSVESVQVLVEREKEGGCVERLEVDLPAVLAVQTGIVPLKYPSFLMLRKAKKQGLVQMELSDLGFDVDRHRRWEYLRLHTPSLSRDTKILQGETSEVAAEFCRILVEDAKVVQR